MEEIEEVLCVNIFDESNEAISQDIKEPPTTREFYVDTYSDKSSSLHVIKNDITADVSCEFLEVAFHQILYHRCVYPKEIFRCCKKYSVTVQMCMYPDLTKYIVEVIKALKPMIAMNHIKKVVLLILQNGNFFEQFVFELARARNQEQKSDDQLFSDLEVSIRECLMKIAAYNSPLPKDPSNCTFEVLAHVDNSAAIELLHTDDSHIKWIKDDCDIASQHHLHPLKTIKDSPYMKLQLYVLSR